jgi:5-methyltetrahydrofolate--homocysteine methyltransferase
LSDARTRLEAILRERIAVLDGSWGVLIQREVRGEEAYRGERFKDHPLDVAGDPDLLNLTRPEVVLGIHRDYFAAGADIATTNTFTATTIGQADYGLEAHAYEMNVAGAQLARQAADEVGGFVAGSVGPLNVTLSLSPRVDDPAYRTHTFDQIFETYAEQMRGLAEGGVDFLLIETIFDTLNAKAAIAAALEVAPQLPLWISFTAIDRSGRNLSGQTVDAFWLSVEHAKPFIVGVNCSLGATQMRGGPVPRRTDVGRLPSERGPAERDGNARRAAAGHEQRTARLCGGRAREHRRRLLRHHARTRQGHNGSDQGTVPETRPR